jgi:two-component system chemotaxis sensor kinase CheA
MPDDMADDMADDRAQFQARLFGTFLKEAAVHRAAIPGLLGKLEAEPGSEDAAQELLREIHSLKGAAGAVEQEEAAFLCRSLEQAVVKVRRGERAADAAFFDAFRLGLALLDDGLAEVARGGKFAISLQFLESMRKLT